MDDQTWLSELHAQIWEEHHDPNAKPYGQRWVSEKHQLPDETLVKFLQVAEGFPCTLANACWGFGISISVWSNPQFPGVAPEVLCVVTSKHLSCVPPISREHFHKGWELFSKVVFRSENVARLKMLRLDLPKGKEHYDY